MFAKLLSQGKNNIMIKDGVLIYPENRLTCDVCNKLFSTLIPDTRYFWIRIADDVTVKCSDCYDS